MKTTFEQLTEIVLPTLEMYKDDLLKHDKNILETYTGSFLYGYRKTGTDLLRLLPTFEQYKERFTNNYADDTQVKKMAKGRDYMDNVKMQKYYFFVLQW